MANPLHEKRWYQTEAVNSLFDFFRDNPGFDASGKPVRRNPLVCLPTGTGKSHVIADFIKEAMRRYPNTRVFMATHVKELIDQNAKKLLEAWPMAPLGIYSAGLKSRDTMQPIIFGGIQSAVGKFPLFGKRDLLVVDEAHLISPNADTSYIKFIEELTGTAEDIPSGSHNINPYLKIIGLTATAYRMGLGCMTNGPIFTDIAYNLCSIDGFNRLVAEGYICPLIPKRTKTELDVSKVGLANGEFAAGALQAAVDKSDITYAALTELVAEGWNRQSWLIFASGVEHAEHICEMLNSAFGISTGVVHSNTKDYPRTDSENAATLKAWKAGELRAIVNMNSLTTGVDHPACDLIGMLRPTMSTGLWVQMLGRGTRPFPGKENCIAEGQKVLTNFGLIPIEKVTKKMLLWDGVDFVSHNGILFCGKQKVIEYEGLTATPDHKVWTSQGWQTFGKCRKEQIGIARTGILEQTISEAENNFTSSNKKGQRFESLYKNLLCSMLETLRNRIHKLNFRQSKLSFLRQPSFSAAMALPTLQRGLSKMQQSKRYGFQALRATWNKILFQLNIRNGFVGSRKLRFTQEYANRQNKQQWKLSNRKPSLFNKFTKPIKYSFRAMERDDAQFSSKAPSYSVCGCYFASFICSWFNRTGDIRKIQKENKTKRVWDIINAGPRNRFTVEGLLVSNCLVLDFAGNTRRLGPINDPVIPKLKGKGPPGDAPVRICPDCNTYNHASARFCIVCGLEFTFEDKINRYADTSKLIRSDLPQIEYFDISRMILTPHQSRTSGKNSLKVSYYCTGPIMRTFYEYYSVESSNSFFRHKSRNWFRQLYTHYNTGEHAFNELWDEDAPLHDSTVLQLSQQGKLRAPAKLKVWINKQQPEVLGYEF